MLQLEDSWIYQAGAIKGKSDGKVEALIGLLTARLGRLEPSIKDLIQQQAQDAPERISAWLQEAFNALDAEAAARIVQRIVADPDRYSSPP